jgi:hypothetical protein
MGMGQAAGTAAALAWPMFSLVLPMIALFATPQRYFTRGVVMSGLKG